MSSPWLKIPLADYEGHMRSPDVRQLDPLADLFEDALLAWQPRSVAVLGAAGGNGLDRIDSNRIVRVCCVDINPRYLEALAKRFPALPGLEMHAVDLTRDRVQTRPVDLAHAALLFEHTGLDPCLGNVLSTVKPAGALSVVLQLPARDPDQNVGPRGYASIAAVRDNFRLIDPAAFQKRLADEGFTCDREKEIPLPQGKRFWMGLFERSGSVLNNKEQE